MIFIFIILKKCCSILSISFTKIILILFIEYKFSFTFFLKKKKIDLKFYKLIFLIGECRPPLFVLFFLIYLFILFILEPFPPPLESTPWRTRVDDSSLKGRGDRASWKISCMKRVAEQLTVAMVLVGMATS